MVQWYKKNELFVQFFLLFLVSILVVALISVLITLKSAEKVYVQAHTKSVTNSIKRVQEDYTKLNDSITNQFLELQKNPYIATYLVDNPLDPVAKYQLLFELTKSLQTSNYLYDKIPTNLLLVNLKGKFFSQNGVYPIDSANELQTRSFFEATLAKPYQIHYQKIDRGYFSYVKNEDGLVVSKAIFDDQDHVVGVALLFVSSSDFSKFYRSIFNEDVDQIVIYDTKKTMITSNQSNQKATKLIDLNSMMSDASLTIQNFPIATFGYTLKLVTNNQVVANELFLQPLIYSLLALMISLSAGMAFWLIKKRIQPLYELKDHLQSVAYGDLPAKIPVSGTQEIRSLQMAYNKMLDDLNDSLTEIMAQEEIKREMEMHALQLQIQPHFIYNTLTAIKFQIMKQENDTAVDAIEAFTRLLQYTIGQSAEMIPLAEELAILADYIKILQMRFGTHVHVHVYQDLVSDQLIVPKLLLQPIVENAFIHAFPNERVGQINLLLSETDTQLKIEIIDDGIGMKEKTDPHKRFSGIGLTNIKERLWLAYKERASFSLTSIPNQGTIVLLILPKKRG